MGDGAWCDMGEPAAECAEGEAAGELCIAGERCMDSSESGALDPGGVWRSVLFNASDPGSLCNHAPMTRCETVEQ